MTDIARYKEKAEWERLNPVLRDSEPGFESDTGKLKIGDGTTRWNALSYEAGVLWTLPETSNAAPDGDATEVTLASVRDLLGTGVDRDGAVHRIVVDPVGRQKISHAQPDPLVGNLVAVNDALVLDMDSLSDAQFFLRGAAHAGYNVAFEYSPDSTAGPGYLPAATPADGAWYPVLAKNVGNATATPATATGVLVSNSMSSFEVSIPAALRVRARVTARTSGTLTVSGVASTASRPVQVGVTGAVTSNLGTAGTTATSLGKAEDAASASGDVGVAILGVRAAATPVAQTSAAGDYGALAIDAEGKQLILHGADPAATFQSVTTLNATATAVAARAAQAAGIRTYVTDITVANTSATATRVDVLDNATIIWSAWVPAGTTVPKNFNTPLRGTAATVLNVQSSVAVTDVRVSLSGYSGI